MKEPRSVACPRCKTKPVDTVTVAPYIRGRFIFHSYGSKRLVGCHRCVKRQLAQEIGSALLSGWFSPVALLVNPVCILWNSLRWPFLKSDPEKVEQLLGDLGICPELVDVTRVAASLAVTMVAADGKAKPQEIETAISLGEELLEGFSSQIFHEAMDNIARLPSTATLAGLLSDVLEDDRKAVVLKYLLAIASADGEMDDSEIAELQSATLALKMSQTGLFG